MANIYEVAELAGVSLATVSRVINPGAKVSDKTREKVLAAMQQLGYQPNSIAQSLATRSSNAVGVLVSELHGPFFGAMLSAIEQTLKAAGKFVMVAAGHSNEAQERDAIRFLVSRNCDALIVHVERLSDKFLIEHDHTTTPLVVVNRKVRGLADHCFSLNNELGGFLATQSLLKRKHKRIAYISGPLDWVDAKQRFAGHKRALSEAGVKYDDRLLHEGDYHETGGQDALNALFAKDIPFTAVVCANDEMAAGAMAAAHERGLSLPAQLSIVGFDDAPISRYVYPKLTTVHYPIADMGRMAARWVLKHVYEQPQDVQQVFEPKVVERDSVSPAVMMLRAEHRAIGTILIVAMSGFLMGFDGSLFTGAVLFIETRFELSKLELGWAVTSHTLAATLSIFLAGPVADRIGRRQVLRAAAIIFFFSAVVAAAAENFPTLIVGRMLSGLGVGAVLVAAPMYIAEISPPALRGRMVSFNQLFIVIGISLAFISNYLIVRLEDFSFAWLTTLRLAEWNWRWMLGLGSLPAIIYLFALSFVPESPRWLAMHGRLDAAKGILEKLHGATFAETELAELRESLGRETGKPAARLRDLWAPELRGVLGLGILVGVFQQITGISSVLAYATVIFERAGAGADASFMQTVFVGLVNLVFTVFALLLIDRVGRRPLLLFGLAGMGLCLVLTSYGFRDGGDGLNAALVLGGMLGFVASFAISIGPVMWVLFSEIFPNRVRGLAISCVGLVNSSVCFTVQLLFPWQMDRFGGAHTFLIYAVFALLGLLVLMKILPETRGRSLEELEETLVRHS